MEEKKLNNEALSALYKNAHTALMSISSITPTTEEPAIKQELLTQYEGYEKIAGKISRLMVEYGIEPKEPNPLKKAALWSSAKLGTLTDNSVSNIADMLIRNTVKGENEINRLINRSGSFLDENVYHAASELLTLEQEYQNSLKSFL